MRFEDVLKEIGSFWTDEPMPFQGGGDTQVVRLEGEFGCGFPDELEGYIATVLPHRHFTFQGYGTFLTLYGFEELSTRNDGYNWNPVKRAPIEGWNSSWLLIGDEEADPVIVDLAAMSSLSDCCPVFQAPHGAGVWRFRQVSSSLPQFLLCAAYLHHALTQLEPAGAIITRKRFLREKLLLADSVSTWLLPRLRRCDATFYDHWVGAFDNV